MKNHNNMNRSYYLYNNELGYFILGVDTNPTQYFRAPVTREAYEMLEVMYRRITGPLKPILMDDIYSYIVMRQYHPEGISEWAEGTGQLIQEIKFDDLPKHIQEIIM